MSHYLALQYSGIQKTILRHSRLWSLSGISQIMQKLNEVDLPAIVTDTRHGGTVLIAGGGKLTASFPDQDLADSAIEDLKRCVSTALPMLEFQIASIRAKNLRAAISKANNKNLIKMLGEQKRRQRGYGVTFNPHLEVCEECGEYPVIEVRIKRTKDGKQTEERRCSVCWSAYDKTPSDLRSPETPTSTSIDKVYRQFIGGRKAEDYQIPRDFQDLFGNDTAKEGKRLAVWMSDTNNMGDKVSSWLSQDDEAIETTFQNLNSTNIEIVAKALLSTFKSVSRGYLPFRIIIAGGDDLCLVMDEKYILDFVTNLSSEYESKTQTLQSLGNLPPDAKPFCFAGCFVVTSVHTPFYKIHAIGEALLKEAKDKSGRAANSVTWRIMAEDQEPVAERLLQGIEKPVFISDVIPGTQISGHLSFSEYITQRKFYGERLSKSHLNQVGSTMIEYSGNPEKVQQELELRASVSTGRSYGYLLADKDFHSSEDLLQTGRLASLFELMSIGGTK